MLRSISILTIIFALSIVNVNNVYAVDNELLLSEDFESGVASNWTIYNSSVSNGWVFSPDPLNNNNTVWGADVIKRFSRTWAVAGDSSWTNYEFKFDFYSIQGEDKNVGFRVADDSNFKMYGLHLVGPAGGGIYLEKFLNSSTGADLASSPYSFENQKWYTVKVQVVNNRITVFIDGNQEFEYVDDQNILGPPIETGKVALAVTTGIAAPTRVRFDNIQVRNLDVLEVPFFFQDGESYSDDAYGYVPGHTIAGQGCWMTSAAMILNAHGITQIPSTTEEDTLLDLDPGTLNAWLIDNNGYDSTGQTLYTPILRYANEYATQTRQNADPEDDTPYFTYDTRNFAGTTQSATLDDDLDDGNPDIMRHLYFYADGTTSTHFYVGKGKTDNEYIINDPLDEDRSNSMDDYNDTFYGLRRFIAQEDNPSVSPSFAPTTSLVQSPDLSLLMFYSDNPEVHILLTDSLGRRVGKDSATGDIYSEIPNSYYEYVPAIISNPTPGPTAPEPGINRIQVPIPSTDEYSLTIYSDSTTNYNVYQYSYSADADVQILDHQGVLPNNGISNINFTYDSQTGTSTVEEPESKTYQDLLTQIRYAQESYQIKPKKLATHWYQLTRLAQSFHNHGMFKIESKLLQLVKQQITQATPRFVTEEAAGELKSTINDLLSQI